MDNLISVIFSAMTFMAGYGVHALLTKAWKRKAINHYDKIETGLKAAWEKADREKATAVEALEKGKTIMANYERSIQQRYADLEQWVRKIERDTGIKWTIEKLSDTSKGFKS